MEIVIFQVLQAFHHSPQIFTITCAPYAETTIGGANGWRVHQ